MRCTECDRIITAPCVSRLSDDRLTFGWCRACVEVAEGVFVELTPNVKLFGLNGSVVVPMGGTCWASAEARSGQRLFGMTILASVLGFWGITMLVAGFARSGQPTPLNPQGTGSSNFLIAGGGGLMGTAAGLLLGVIRARRRANPLISQSHRPGRYNLAHLPALAGLCLIVLAATRSEPRFSALSVICSAPFFVISWFWLGRDKRTDERAYGCHSELLEV